MAGLIEGISSKVTKAVSTLFARQDKAMGTDFQKGLNIPYIGRKYWYGGTVTPWGRHALLDYLFIDQDLLRRFADYEEMDEFPEGWFSLNIYADDATTANPDNGKAIWAYSQDRQLENELNGVLRRCQADDNSWPLVRELCKYGNLFGEILVRDPKQGVIGINFMPPPSMRRIETPRDGLVGFVQDPNGIQGVNSTSYYDLKNRPNRAYNNVVAFDPWEISHWRLRLKYFNAIYGYSALEGGRAAWKRLAMLEDAQLIYKFERAHQQFAFYVDIGSMDMRRGRAEVETVKNSIRRRKLTNDQGMLDMKRDVLSGDEDFFIPSKDGRKSTDIELLQSPDYSEVESLRHFRNKWATGVNIPPSRFGWEDTPDSRNMLSSTSIDFARANMRVQREFCTGWERVCNVHLAVTRGGRPVDRETWRVRMNVPSQILELARMEVLSARSDVARTMREDVGLKHVLMHVYDFSEDLAVDIMKARASEQIDQAKVDAASSAAQQVGESVWNGSRAISKDEMMTTIGRDAALVTRLGRISGLLEDVRRAAA